MIQKAMFCVAFLTTLSGAMGEMAPNPVYQSWAAYKPGTSVTVKEVTVSGDETTEMLTVYTLRSVTPEKVTLASKSTMTVDGSPLDIAPQTKELPAKVKKSTLGPPRFAGAEVTTKTLDTETVKIGKASYACQVAETTTKMKTATTVHKAWKSKTMPGQIVKTETKMTGSVTMTSTLTVIEVKIVR